MVSTKQMMELEMVLGRLRQETYLRGQALGLPPLPQMSATELLAKATPKQRKHLLRDVRIIEEGKAAVRALDAISKAKGN